MYNVQLDENKFYTGTYAKIGKVINGVDVNELPPSTSYQLVSYNEEKTRVVDVIENYIIKESTVLNTETNTNETKSEIVVISDSEVDSYKSQGITVYNRVKTDANGTPVTKEESYTVTNTKWNYVASKDDSIKQIELETAITNKLKEVADNCSAAIYAGTDVTFSDGLVKHFSMSQNDQINIMGLSMMILQGITQIPYHNDGEDCQIYSIDDAKKLIDATTKCKMYHTTYCNQLNMEIRSCTTVDAVNVIHYGDPLNEERDAKLVAITGVSSRTK